MRLDEPIIFAPNRVWRCYAGGALLDRFVGNRPEADGHKPEDWLASTVRALNGEHSQGPDEGLARTLQADGKPGPLLAELAADHAEALFGPKHVARFGTSMGLLCKYLDSAVRLPVQCHPDVAMAKRLYHSPFGKSESWHVLDTRSIGGQEPYLLMGFKPGVTAEGFAKAVETQDVAALESMLHKIHARPGETYMVPGRLAHAIGPGVFMIEVQEPSDWVVQPERFCADTRLSDDNMWGPLAPEQGLGVFDYTGLTKDELLARVKPKEMAVLCESGGAAYEVIGKKHTEAFALWRAEATGRLRIALPRAFGLVVVTGGSGTIRWAGGSRQVRRGQYFLQPCGVDAIEYAADAGPPMTLAIGLPPEP